VGTRCATALVICLVALLGASSARSEPAAPALGPGYVVTIQFSYDSPPFPDTRYRVTAVLTGEVCGDPLTNPWAFVGERSGGPSEPLPTLTTVTFAAANPATITGDRWSDATGAEIARIDFQLRLTAGSPPVLTAGWESTGDILNVVATPPEVAATPRNIAVCPAAQQPPPPPPEGTPTGRPAAGYPFGKVKVPGAKTFSPITPGQALPPGTVIDVSRGAGVLLTDGRQGRLTISGQRDGVPSIVALAKVAGLVELRLTRGSFKACGKRALAAASKTAKPVRRLWANGKGKFRTKGRYATATIRGTRWLTADFCERTLLQAAQGSLLVRDLVAKKNVVLRAPHSYSAQPKKR